MDMNTPPFLRCLLFGPLLMVCMRLGAQDQLALATPAPHYGGDGAGITSNVPLNEINIHAFRHFMKKFPNASGESWLKTDLGYVVSFMDNSRRTQAHYNSKGAFLYTITYYAGKDLSRETGVQVKKAYPGYRVGVVTEITDGSKTLRLVKIENPAFVKTLSISDGKMDLVEDLVNGG